MTVERSTVEDWNHKRHGREQKQDLCDLLFLLWFKKEKKLDLIV